MSSEKKYQVVTGSELVYIEELRQNRVSFIELPEIARDRLKSRYKIKGKLLKRMMKLDWPRHDRYLVAIVKWGKKNHPIEFANLDIDEIDSPHYFIRQEGDPVYENIFVKSEMKWVNAGEQLQKSEYKHPENIPSTNYIDYDSDSDHDSD